VHPSRAPRSDYATNSLNSFRLFDSEGVALLCPPVHVNFEMLILRSVTVLSPRSGRHSGEQDADGQRRDGGTNENEHKLPEKLLAKTRRFGTYVGLLLPAFSLSKLFFLYSSVI
jgi:hypothetical protein